MSGHVGHGRLGAAPDEEATTDEESRDEPTTDCNRLFAFEGAAAVAAEVGRVLHPTARLLAGILASRTATSAS